MAVPGMNRLITTSHILFVAHLSDVILKQNVQHARNVRGHTQCPKIKMSASIHEQNPNTSVNDNFFMDSDLYHTIVECLM